MGEIWKCSVRNGHLAHPLTPSHLPRFGLGAGFGEAGGGCFLRGLRPLRAPGFAPTGVTSRMAPYSFEASQGLLWLNHTPHPLTPSHLPRFGLGAGFGEAGGGMFSEGAAPPQGSRLCAHRGSFSHGALLIWASRKGCFGSTILPTPWPLPLTGV